MRKSSLDKMIRGWFIGNFPRAVYRTTEFEVAVKSEKAGARVNKHFHKVASEMKLDLKEGVYLATSGPNYETKAEIGAFRQLGADAVGMSTVPSVIAANFLKMRVLTLSCIANPAADLHPGEMNHKEVLAAMNELAPKAVDLIRGVLGDIFEKNV